MFPLAAHWWTELTALVQTNLGVVIGLVVATALLLLNLFLLPKASRRRLIVPMLLLTGHVLTLALHYALPSGSSPSNAARGASVFLLLACLGVCLFLFITQVLLRRYFETVSKIFLDVVLGLIYGLALFMTLHASKVELESLITGSALLTAVIGLSMRDTLGNVFAGLALQAQQPFRVGDWIQYQPQASQVGQVIEVNWRATTVRTGDGVEVSIPNAALAASNIVNLSRPGQWTRRNVYVWAPTDVPPQHVKKVILDAVVGAWGVLEQPAASVLTMDSDDRGMKYWVRFCTAEFAKRNNIDSDVRDRIWYAMHRHGISLPVDHHVVFLRQPELSAEEDNRQTTLRLSILRHVDFFATLPEEMLQQLATTSRMRLYATNETIIRQGDQGEELFIVNRGQVAVTLQQQGGKAEVELARMGPNTFFGEMSLLTGEPRSATVRATQESELLVVDKAAFRQVLATSPQLAEHISEIVAGRQAGRDGARFSVAGDVPTPEEWSRRLVKKIRDFFAL